MIHNQATAAKRQKESKAREAVRKRIQTKKAKENCGKIAVWQHGGVYGYTNYVQHYFTDYKKADYWLSFGKSNIEDIAGMCGGKGSSCVEVGSNVMFGKKKSRNAIRRGAPGASGLFVPGVVQGFSSLMQVKWQDH